MCKEVPDCSHSVGSKDPKPVSEPDKIDKCIRGDAVAQEIVVTRVDKGPITHVLTCDTSEQMWTQFKSVFDKKFPCCSQ